MKQIAIQSTFLIEGEKEKKLNSSDLYWAQLLTKFIHLKINYNKT